MKKLLILLIALLLTLVSCSDKNDSQNHTNEFGEWEITVKATCSENGISGYKCQNCDAVTGRAYTAKAPHDYKTEVINANPLCGMNSKEISTI